MNPERSPAAPVEDWYVPTAFEVAGGWVHGRSTAPATVDPPGEPPSEVLRAVLRDALTRGPCLVPFSGGRDSSLLLAVTCSVAREAGVTLPLAVTFRHPGLPESEETSWQDLVMEHLRLQGMSPEWRIVEVTDELDIVGPVLAPLLEERRHPLWPPNMASTVALADGAQGATILSGDYGDEVLGVRRATVIAGLLRRRGRGLSLAYWRAASLAATPRLVLAGAIRLRGSAPHWLSSRGVRRWRALSGADALHDPFPYDRSVRAVVSWRGPVLGFANLERICRRRACHLETPLADPRVISALAAHGGWKGPQSRGYATSLLGGDLLPDRLYGRDTKADFLTSRFNRHTVATVDAWKDTDISREWVDTERLRSAWEVRRFHPQMAGLVQQAWLAQHGLS